jgi:hypothetical protein
VQSFQVYNEALAGFNDGEIRAGGGRTALLLN